MLTKMLLLDEEHVDEARRLFGALARGDVILAIPVIAYFEAGSSVLKAVRAGRISDATARFSLSTLQDLGVEVLASGSDAAELVEAAYPIATDLGKSIYDASFLALSRLLDVPFITADKPVWEAARGTFDVVWLPQLQLP